LIPHAFSKAAGLDRRHWASAAPIRTIFREAFKSARLPYFNPHSFRNTLVRLGEKVCQSPEQFKAWSQNLGHEKALTTFLNYGEVAHDRQAEIIRNLKDERVQTIPDAEKVAEAVLRQMSQAGLVRAGNSGTAERS
jgi:integrase/recombinase XerD